MSWIISTHNAEQDRIEYVRRITPLFVSWTLDRGEAYRYPTRADARAAIRGRGLLLILPTTAERDTTAPETAPGP